MHKTHIRKKSWKSRKQFGSLNYMAILYSRQQEDLLLWSLSISSSVKSWPAPPRIESNPLLIYLKLACNCVFVWLLEDYLSSSQIEAPWRRSSHLFCNPTWPTVRCLSFSRCSTCTERINQTQRLIRGGTGLGFINAHCLVRLSCVF